MKFSLPFTKKEKSDNDLSHDEIVAILESHPLLEELREWGGFRCKVLNIKDATKKRMAEYYLELFFNELRRAIINTIRNYEKYIDDTTLLNNVIIDTINDVRTESLSNGVPLIFLDKFTNYLYKQTKILSLSFKDIDKFKYYDGIIEKSAFRLDLGFMMVRCITVEIEDVINNMNGELRAALEGSIFDR